jgi:predicted nucleic acid-binding protein
MSDSASSLFVDTNILVYAHTRSSDPRHERARQKVRDLWAASEAPALSVQVLQEFHANLVRKAGMPIAESARLVRSYLAWRVIENGKALLREGLVIQERFQLSIWDALIIAAARQAGASVLWSEDLQAGANYDGVRVVNPFREQ